MKLIKSKRLFLLCKKALGNLLAITSAQSPLKEFSPDEGSGGVIGSTGLTKKPRKYKNHTEHFRKVQEKEVAGK